LVDRDSCTPGHKLASASGTERQVEVDGRDHSSSPGTDPDQARLVEIQQEFKAKAMPYFEMAERILEYHTIYVKRNSAQSAQNPKAGRPGVVSGMARELAVPGNSDAARRAWIYRALKVAKMSPGAVAAAKAAKLDRNRKALTEIVEAGDADEQLKKVSEVQQRKADSKKEAKKYFKKIVRIPIAKRDALTAELLKFAREMDVEIL
jgi:hypothetical protein